MNQQLKTHFSKFSDELVWEYYGENRSFHKFNNKSLNIYIYRQIDRQMDRKKKQRKETKEKKQTKKIKENKRKQKKKK